MKKMLNNTLSAESPKSASPSSEQPLEVYKLEPRIMLNAAGMDGIDTVVGAEDIAEADVSAWFSDTEGLADSLEAPQDLVDFFSSQALVDESSESAQESIEQEPLSNPTESISTQDLEVVFVDRSAPDSEQLLADLRERNDGRSLLVVEIGADEDGIVAINETLAWLSDVEAVHIVSHGDSSGFQLGSTRIDNATIAGRAGEVAQWQSALDSDADLLIYGCDLASSSEGETLLESIGALCDCDVAASDDLTGHVDLGGDWELEYAFGIIDTGVAFTQELQDSWAGVLATFTVTNTLDSGSGSLRDAITLANANVDADTIEFDIAGTPADGTHTITLLTALPDIIQQVTIDGSTEPDFVTVPVVEIDGSALGAGADGLRIDSPGTTTISGLAINYFAGTGIDIAGTSTAIIDGNYLGINPATGLSAPNGTGIEVAAGATATITNNNISNNGGTAINDLSASATLSGNTISTVGTSPVTVNTTADTVDGDTSSIDALLIDRGADGLISLREAVIAANNTTGVDTIHLAAGTYTFSLSGSGEDFSATGDLDINDDVTIIGDSAASTIIDASSLDRVFEVRIGTLDLSNVTITGGSNTLGAGVFVQTAAAFAIDQVRISGNTGSNGAGVYTRGTFTATKSTISGNVASTMGGGVFIKSGTASLTNVTISGNTGTSSGGGLRVESTTSLRNVTVADNISGSGVAGVSYDNSGGALSILNSIVASNTGAFGDIGVSGGGITSLGNNIFGDDAGDSASGSGYDVTDLLDETGLSLGALADNGGETFTHALLVGSAGINGGNNTGAPSDDQRGVVRDANVDIGAFEYVNTEEVLVHSVLAPSEGGTITVGSSNLSTTDAEQSATEIVYTLDVAATQGELFLSGVLLGATDTFTQDDVNNSRISYVHNGSETLADSFDFTVDDGFGTSTSDTFDILATGVNDSPTFATLPGGDPTTVDSTASANGANAITSADINGDGNLDLISATDQGEILWYQGDGAGGFAAGVSVNSATLNNFKSIVAVDIDGDTDIDIVAANDGAITGDADIVIYENGFFGSGTVSFTTQVIDAATRDGAHDLKVADIDGDGRLDIIASYYESISTGYAVLYEQNVAGVFTANVVATYAGTYGIDIGDFDGDTDLDFATANFQDGEVRWYENDGNATAGFTGQTLLSVSAVFDVAVGDINGDLIDDIGYVAWNGELGWLESSGGVSPTFTHHLIDSTGSTLRHIELGDIDGVNGVDVLVSDTGSDEIEIYLNDGSENFTRSALDTTTNGPKWVETADINGDGSLDIIFAENAGDSIGVHVNQGSGSFIRGTTNEDASIGLAVQIADSDASTFDLEVVVSVVNGTITVPTAGLNVTAGGSGTSSITFEGTVSEINTALASLTYTPTADFVGLGEVQITVDDQGNSGSGGSLTATETLFVDVIAVNDAPVLVSTGNLVLTDVSEDDSDPTGDTVAAILASDASTPITDVDSGALHGIAVTSVDNTNGVWEFRLTGGDPWAAISPVSSTSALLLTTTSEVRFVPSSNFSGSAGEITFRAWDQSSGTAGTKVSTSSNGGTTSFSTGIETAAVNVTSVNDAPVLDNSGTSSLASIDEDALSNDGDLVSAIIASGAGGDPISDVDADPEGISIHSIVTPGNGFWQYSINAGTDWLDVGSVSDSSSLLLGASDRLRYVPGGDGVDASTIEYRAWDTTTGAAGSKVDTSVTGGTTAFSSAVETADIAVTSGNDAPSISGTNLITNGDFTTLAGWTTSGGVTNDGTPESARFGEFNVPTDGVLSQSFTTVVGQTYELSFDYGDGHSNRDQDMRVSVTGATTRFSQDYNSGVAEIEFLTYRFSFVADSTTSTLSFTDISALSSSVDGFIDNVTASQLADVTFTEDGAAVAADAGILISDQDSANLQTATVVISSNYASGEDFLHFTDQLGITGSYAAGTLSLIGNTTVANWQTALASITFENTSENSDGLDRELTWTINDGSLDSNDRLSTVHLTKLNDAPVLDNSGSPSLTSISEDDTNSSGNTVADLLATGAGGDPITDAESDPDGIAIVSVDNSNGNWQYRLTVGDPWQAIAPVSATSGLLLADTALIRFVPDADFAGNAGNISFHAWDQTSGANGTLVDPSSGGGTSAFSLATESASIDVTAVNDDPVLSLPGAPQTYIENGSATVIDGSATVTDIDSPDLNGGVLSVSILSGGQSLDVLQVQHTGTGVGEIGVFGATIAYEGNAIGTLVAGNESTPLSVTFNTANASAEAVQALMRAITFESTSEHPVETARTFRFTLSDGDTGSQSADSNTVTPQRVNDAPVLSSAGNLVLTTIPEDSTDPAGNTVAQILASDGGDPLTDVDTGDAEGIAVTGVDNTNGTWQFRLNVVDPWLDIGAVTPSSALLLADTSLVRFVPDADFAGNSGDLTFVGWDQTSGTAGSKVNASVTGGTSAFSSGSETASLTISGGNDDPVLSLPGASQGFVENSSPVLIDATATVSDVDSSDLNGGALTVSILSGGDTLDALEIQHAGFGSGQIGVSGGSISYEGNVIGTYVAGDESTPLTVTFTTANATPEAVQALARSITFETSSEDPSTSARTFRFTVTDGDGGTISVDSNTITPSRVNDAPLIDNTGDLVLTSINEDDSDPAGNTVAQILASDGASPLTDVDSGALQGIAITSVDDTNGTWEFRLTVGDSWQAIAPVSATSALLLTDSSLVRFVPSADFNGSAGQIEFHGWDQTSGTAGAKADPSSAGGTSAFSVAVETATLDVLAVNDDPIISLVTVETMDEGTPLVFSVGTGNAITITDIDASTVSVTLTASDGTLTLGSPGSVSFATGDGTDDLTMTFSGSVAAVNSALSTVTFTNAINHDGDGSIHVFVTDGGGTGSGGTKTDTEIVSITIDSPTPPPVAGDAFLQGNFIEAGLGADGAFGSDGLAPVGFVDAGSQLGFISDPDKDGIATHDGDFLLPGSPEEGWGVHVGGSSFNNGNTIAVPGIAGSLVNYQDTGTQQSVDWTGSVSGLQIDKTYTVSENALYIDVVVDLTNTTGTTFTDVYYLRNIDADNDFDNGSVDQYSTTNTIVSQGNGGTGKAIVTATQTEGSYLALVGFGDNARVTHGGFANRNALDVYNGTGGLSQSGSSFLDEAVSLAFKVDTIAAGQTESVNFRYYLGQEAAPSLDLDANNDGGAVGNDITVGFTENGGPVSIADSDAVITDLDSSTLASLTARITNDLDGTSEVLSVNVGATGIATSYAGGVLTLTGPASVTDFQSVLRTLTYDNTSDTPDQTTRVIEITVTDGTNTSELATANVNITGENDAPVLSPSAPSLTTITEDAVGNSGDSIASLLGTSVTDADTSASEGIAITATNNSAGTWQFSTDGGGSWADVGTVSDSAALLLRDVDRVRFVPDTIQSDTANFTFRAWDQTNGSQGAKLDASTTGGTTAFSAASDVASITTTGLNDDPFNSGSLPSDVVVTEDVATAIDLSLLDLADIDHAGGSLRLTLATSLGGTLSATAGAGITIGGNNTGTLTLDGTLANLNAYLNVATNLEYTGDTNVNGDDADTVSITLNDNGNSGTGGGTDISLGSVNVDITSVNDDPVIGGSLSASGDEGDTIPITTVELTALDPDDSGTGLTYTLTSTPANGRLELSSNPGVSITTFTQQDIIDGLVQYVHLAGENTSDSFDFELADGGEDGALADASTFNILISPVNDAPVLGTNQLTIDEGETVAITTAELSSTDSDNAPSALTYTISSLTGGQFELTSSPGAAVTSFTQQQVNDGDVVFVHDGDESAPAYDVTISDGSLTDGPTAATISFTNLNDAAVIGGSLSASGDEGDTIPITTVELTALDPDDSGTGLTYTLTSAPANGRLELSSNPGVSITTFTQQDIIDGLVQYVHLAGENTSDSFDFQLADGGEDGALADVSTFNILISPVNDAPVLGTNQLTIDEGETVAITTAELSSTDSDNAPSALTYTISSLTGGQFELTSSPGAAVTSFTQQQVNDGDVIFVHDGAESAPAYDVTISDGSLTDGPSAATISFTNLNDAAVIGGSLSASGDEGDTIPIRTVELTALDPDDSGTGLTYTLTSTPANGRLELSSNPGVSITTFTQQDIVDGLVQYVHLAGENTSDSFDFQLADGGENGALADVSTFNILISPVNDAPVLGTNQLTIDEGETVAITTAELSSTDSDNAPSALTYTISSLTGGQFELTSSPGAAVTSFTQQQVNDGDVIFVHDGAESAPAYDVTISDGSLTDGPSAATISFTGVNDGPLIGGTLVGNINEGGTLTLSAAALTAIDPDDSGAGLLYTISAAPSNGRIEYSTAAGVAITTFTQADLDAGIVRYVHLSGENTADSFDVQLQDGGENGVGSDEATFTINVNQVNDDPVNAGSLPASVTVTEDVAGNVDLSLVHITDSDAFGSNITLTLSTNSGGTLSAAASAGITITGSTTSSITVSGAPADINTYLNDPNNIQFTGFQHANGVAADRIDLFVTDHGNTGIGGGGNIALGGVNVDIQAINDDPGNSGTIASDLSVTEDVASNLDLSAINLTDVDSASGLITLTLSSAGGLLTSTPGAGVTVTGSGTTLLTLTGTQVDLNAFMNVPSNVQYLGALNTFGNDLDVVSLTVNDNGNIGLGGGVDVALGNVNIDITAVNDAPLLATPSLTISEGGIVTLSAANLSATDVDNVDASLTFGVTAVSGGYFSHAAALTTPITAFTQSDVTAGNIRFTHDGGELAPSFSVTASDGALIDGPTAANISFTNVNDAATVTATGATLNYTENAAAITVDGGITISDPDSTSFVGATIELLNHDPSTDRLLFTSTASIVGAYDASSGQLILTGTGTLAEYEAALRSIQFDVVSENPSPATRTIQFTLDDGIDVSAATRQYISVTPVNDAPIAVADDYTVFANGVLEVLAPGTLDNDFDHESDPLSLFFISGPANGTVVVHTNGRFVYTPANGYYGFDSFQYAVSDGLLISAAQTVTIEVQVVSTGTNTDTDTDTDGEVTVSSSESTEDNTQDEQQETIVAAAASIIENSSEDNTKRRPRGNAPVLQVSEVAPRKEIDRVDRTEVALVSWAVLSQQIEEAVRSEFRDMSDPQRVIEQLVGELQQAISWDSWDEYKQSAEDDFDYGTGVITVGAASTTAAGVASFGYMIWVLRGGALLATMAGSLPSWRLLDPASLILASNKQPKADDAVERLMS